MIIDDLDYDDEEWRIARVASARVTGEEHRIHTNHHGGMVRSHYVCQDCETVYFDPGSKVAESPEIVHGVIAIDEKLMDLLVDLAVHYSSTLGPVQKFLEEIVKAHGLRYVVPDLGKARGQLDEDLGL